MTGAASGSSPLRMWRGLPGFDDRRPSRPWLYRIATNACLDAIARRSSRMLPIDSGPPACPAAYDPGEPQAELPWIEPYPDEQLGLDDGYASPEARYEQRGAVELAFIAALQHLSGRQRAVLILREVLGFSAKEVAQALDSTPASVNCALQRAHKAVEDRLPEHSHQANLRMLGDQRVRDLVERYRRRVAQRRPQPSQTPNSASRPRTQAARFRELIGGPGGGTGHGHLVAGRKCRNEPGITPRHDRASRRYQIRLVWLDSASRRG